MQITFPVNSGLAASVFREFLERDAASASAPAAFRAYYLLRRFIPIPVRQMLQRLRNRRLHVPDDWYLPREFCDRLVDALGRPLAEAIAPWPDDAQFAFVLTHDVETADGMRLIAPLAEIEEQLGFRSSWNVVPYKYPIDEGLLRDLQRGGFEIGIHGYNHDGRLYASERVFRERAVHINDAIRRYGAVGFRSPMVHRNLEWLQLLDIDYDASYFDIDPFQAMPGGVGTLWPFIAGKFVELPYTLPQDHTLFVTLGQQDISVWRKKLEFIAERRGMGLLLTHPDYLNSPRCLDLYRALLMHVKETGGFWHALPREVAAWWRQRAAPACEADALVAHESSSARWPR